MGPVAQPGRERRQELDRRLRDGTGASHAAGVEPADLD